LAGLRSSEKLLAAFAAALPDDPTAERGRWFGYPVAFVNGNMFAGLREERLVVRVSDVHQAELLLVGGTPFLKSYLVVPSAIVADPDALRGWVARAFAHVLTLEPKAKAGRRRGLGGGAPGDPPAAEVAGGPSASPTCLFAGLSTAR